MKIQAKIRYALRILIDLSEHEGLVTLKNLEQTQNISAKFAKQIMQNLERADLVNSKRGSKGGYFLNRGCDEIKVSDVFKAFDEDFFLVPCNNGSEGVVCDLGSTCRANKFWLYFSESMTELADSTSLDDIINSRFKEIHDGTL